MIKFPDVIYLIDDGKNSFWTEYLKRGDKYSTYVKKETIKNVFELVNEFMANMESEDAHNHITKVAIALKLQRELNKLSKDK